MTILSFNGCLFQTLGYQRTLQATDLWKLDDARSSEVLAEKFDESWKERQRKAETWNTSLEKGLVQPGLLRRGLWVIQSVSAGRNCGRRRKELEKKWREVDGRKTPSIALALNDALGFFFWTGGMFKVNR